MKSALRSGILKWFFKSGICRKLWPYCTFTNGVYVGGSSGIHPEDEGGGGGGHGGHI